MVQQLPAELRADAAGCSGDQHGFVAEPAAEACSVNLHGRPSEQVGNVDRSWLQLHAAADQRMNRGNDGGRAAGCGSLFLQIRDFAAQKSLRQQHHLIDAMLRDQSFQPFCGADYPDATSRAADQVAVFWFGYHANHHPLVGR